MERIRAAAEPVQVNPMRTDFHFFVEDLKENIRALAEKELQEDHKNDNFLLFSNMNARLMKTWEDSSSKTRSTYMAKEEEDRRRFMTEDEIASRHCATLTARARSPRPGSMKKDEQQQQQQQAEPPSEQDDKGKKRNSPTQTTESPPKRNKTGGKEGQDDDDEEEQGEGSAQD